jgi:hypothetical protein
MRLRVNWLGLARDVLLLGALGGCVGASIGLSVETHRLRADVESIKNDRNAATTDAKARRVDELIYYATEPRGDWSTTRRDTFDRRPSEGGIR